MQQIVEGAFLVLISAAIPLLFIALLWLPEEASESNIVRIAVLTLACTSWTLQWFGAWKLSAPSQDSCANRFDTFWGKAMRVASLIMLFFPVPWGMAAMWRKVGYWDWELTYLQVLFFSGVVSLVIFYQNLHQLMSRAGARSLQGVIYLSMIGGVLVQLMLNPTAAYDFERQPNSFTFITCSPNLVIGSQIAPVLLVDSLRYGGPHGWPIPTFVASIVLCATTMIFITKVLRARYHTCQKFGARLLRKQRVTFSHLVTSAHSRKTR